MAEYPKTERQNLLKHWMPGCAKQKSHKWNCRFFETLEENLEENIPFFIQVMMKQV